MQIAPDQIPTGLGKTAAVVLAWLWNRLFSHLSTHNRQLSTHSGRGASFVCLLMRRHS